MILDNEKMEKLRQSVTQQLNDRNISSENLQSLDEQKQLVENSTNTINSSNKRGSLAAEVFPKLSMLIGNFSSSCFNFLATCRIILEFA